MTTDTDKLVELLRETGAEEAVAGLFYVTPDKLAAFRDRIVASLCADVEPLSRLLAAYKESTPGVWRKGLTTHHTVTETGYKIGEFHHAEDASFCDVAHEVTPAIASTAAAITAQRDQALARVAELEKDAARYRWLRSVPNAFKAQRIVNDTPHGMDATIDAAMNGGNQ